MRKQGSESESTCPSNIFRRQIWLGRSPSSTSRGLTLSIKEKFFNSLQGQGPVRLPSSLLYALCSFYPQVFWFFFYTRCSLCLGHSFLSRLRLRYVFPQETSPDSLKLGEMPFCEFPWQPLLSLMVALGTFLFCLYSPIPTSKGGSH